MAQIEVTIFGLNGQKHNLFVTEHTSTYVTSGGNSTTGLWVDGTYYSLLRRSGTQICEPELRVLNEACGVIHAAVMDAAAVEDAIRRDAMRVEALRDAAKEQTERAGTMSRASLISRIERWQNIVATDPAATEIACDVINVLTNEIRRMNEDIELLDLRHIAMMEGYSEDAYGRWVKAIPDALPEEREEDEEGWDGASADDGLPPAAYVVSKLLDHLDTLERAKLLREFGEMTATINAFADETDIVDTSMAVLALLVSRGLSCC